MPDKHGQVYRLDAEIAGKVLVVKVNILNLQYQVREAVAGVFIAMEVAVKWLFVVLLLHAAYLVGLRDC